MAHPKRSPISTSKEFDYVKTVIKPAFGRIQFVFLDAKEKVPKSIGHLISAHLAAKRANKNRKSNTNSGDKSDISDSEYLSDSLTLSSSGFQWPTSPSASSSSDDGNQILEFELDGGTELLVQVVPDDNDLTESILMENQQMIHMTEQGLKEAESAMIELKDLFLDLSNLVSDQGKDVVNIEDIVASSANDIDKGTKDLSTASKWATFGLGAAGAIAGGLTMGPVGVYAGAQSMIGIGAWVAGGAVVGGVLGGKFAKNVKKNVDSAEEKRKEEEKEDPKSK
eukprot:TRINITY_DN1685_c0_g1_i1.p1 TRINITY_DN1685_c0_g1~~TRINITY_DN1685_c0_g1_i1.p1  ORF type:complete len:281 (-),score=89.71 TRINITY_DN1685_c0_g1_i1:404-1246(-)